MKKVKKSFSHFLDRVYIDSDDETVHFMVVISIGVAKIDPLVSFSRKDYPINK